MGEDTHDDAGHNVQSLSSSPQAATETQEDHQLKGIRDQNAGNDDDNRAQEKSLLRRIYEILTWAPPRCRWDPKNPPRLTMTLNLLFGFACTFTVRFSFSIPGGRCS